MAKTRSSGRTTIDRAEIRRWVESKGGCPAHVKGTGRGNDPGVLRIDYPGYSGVETLTKLSWDEWFKWFDKNNLAFLYQPSTRFSKLVSRDSATLETNGRRATPRRTGGAKRATTAKRGTAKRTTKKPTARTTTQRRAATTGRGTVKRGATTTKRAGAAKRPTKRPTTKRAAKRTATAKRRAAR